MSKKAMMMSQKRAKSVFNEMIDEKYCWKIPASIIYTKTKYKSVEQIIEYSSPPKDITFRFATVQRNTSIKRIGNNENFDEWNPM